MKALLILIAALALPAQAVTFAHVKNDAKGKIVLTDEGCWRDDDLTVLVVWEKEGTKRYYKKIFTVVKRNEWA